MASSSIVPLDKSVFLDEHRETFAIGDIHGDMDALIICLRDCCKVIKKKEEIPFDSKVRDADLVNLMNMETINEREGYKIDLNYEWCVENKIVVFTGDLLDGFRSDNEIVSGTRNGEYPLEEIKIFLFLRKIRLQALEHTSDVLLILGNHEFLNIFDSSGDIKTLYSYLYTTKLAKTIPIDYDGNTYERTKFFMFNNPGSKLIGFSGYRVFLIINNILFVHSGLRGPLNEITYGTLTNMNTSIKDSINTDSNLKIIDPRSYRDIRDFISDRTQSDYSEFNNRHKNDFSDYFRSKPSESDEDKESYYRRKEKIRIDLANYFCEKTNEKITRFCEIEHICGKPNILIVGHEQQSDVIMTRPPTNVTILHNAVRNGNVIEYFTPFQEMSVRDTERERGININMVPGSVNIECIHDDPNYASIYKIDVSMSKAFDINPRIASQQYKKHFRSIIGDDPNFFEFVKTQIIDNGIEHYNTRENYRTILENRTGGVEIDEYVVSLMRARCPTVLHIKFDPTEVISVIRSSLKNTLIHQPRGNSFDYPDWLINDFLSTTTPYTNPESY